jgi:hypothetical protein
MTPITCVLTGSDTARVGDIVARGRAPVFDLCRLLVAAGFDPESPLKCYRGDMLCLRIRSIEKGAGLTIRETSTDGPRVVRWKPWPSRAVTAPIEQNGLDVSEGGKAVRLSVGIVLAPISVPRRRPGGTSAGSAPFRGQPITGGQEADTTVVRARTRCEERRPVSGRSAR